MFVCYSLPYVQEEEDEDGPGMLEWHPARKRHQQYALPGREAPLLLQSRVRRKNHRLLGRADRALLPVHRA